MLTSSRIKSGRSCADFLERFIAAARFRHGVAVRGERGAQDAANLRLVVDDQNFGGGHELAARARPIGRVNEKTEPWPRWLVRLIVPPCASTIAFAIGRPIPVPSTL